MTDRPIIMSAPMVRAILREIEKPGTGKTQTRRLAWRDYRPRPDDGHKAVPADVCVLRDRKGGVRPSPWQKVKPGDRLWVRETCRAEQDIGPFKSNGVSYAAGGKPMLVGWQEQRFLDWTGLFVYRGDLDDGGKTVPTIHMPRWASRLTLDVTAVKIERLKDISEEDARAEGVDREPGLDGRWWDYTVEHINIRWSVSARASFATLWQSLHGASSWDANPEVVAITFKPYLCNIDRMKEAA